MKSHTAESEGISSLPAPILHHILSFLGEKEAVQTCVVSKSWRHLWCTRPKFSLEERSFGKDKEQFIDVLERSFQVYYDRKLCIDDFNVKPSEVDPALVRLLEKWIPMVAVKKFHLSASYLHSGQLPSALFESESLQELYLRGCNLRQIQIVGKNNIINLKTLHLEYVSVDDETFAKFLSSCSIENLSLCYCAGLGTVNMPNHHNLKSFEVRRIDDGVGSIEIYLPSSIGRIIIDSCPNWYHRRNYFHGLTCLELSGVPLSEEWFNNFSFNFPCLEELQLYGCNGFDEFELSSPSIKKLHIRMGTHTDQGYYSRPKHNFFPLSRRYLPIHLFYSNNLSEWNSEINLSLVYLDASQWFLKLSELVAAFSQSRINSLSLLHSSNYGTTHIEHPSHTSVCCGASYKPVAIKSLDLYLRGVYYDFFFSDLVIGLFRFVRPREIRQFQKDEFLCRTLQMGSWEEEDEGMRSVYFWQQDLEGGELASAFWF